MISYLQLAALADPEPASISFTDDEVPAVLSNKTTIATEPRQQTMSASERLRAAAEVEAAKKSKKTATKKAAKQGGSVMIDKTPGAPDVDVTHRIFGIDFPEWISPWMVYGGLGLIAIFVGTRFLGGRRQASNPFDWLLGDAGDERRGGAGALERHRNADVRRAAKFRREFHWGIPARHISRKKVSPVPRVLTELGELTAVTYKTNKRGEKAQFFHHEFEGRKPKLGMDIRNRRLHVVGGSYTVKAAGITG